MNEPNEPGSEAAPETYILPEGVIYAEPPEPPPAPAATELTPSAPAKQSPEDFPSEELPVERQDPFGSIRDLPWMNRKLSPSGRVAILVRRDLEAFPALEGRDPNGADIDAIVKKHVDHMAPIFRREQATGIAYDELEKRHAARIAMVGAAPGLLHGSAMAAEAAKETAKRAAPFLAAMPAGVLAPAAAAATALVPTTSEDGAFDLGEGLRFRVPPGSLQGEIERRIGDRWERLGIRADLNAGADGTKVLLDDAAGFANAVGAAVAGRLASAGIVGERPPAAADGRALSSAIRWTSPGDIASLDALGPTSDRLPIAEMRVLTRDQAGKRFGDIAREDVEQFCPAYARLQGIASEAGRIARAEGPASHRQYGQRTHYIATQGIREAAVMRELLENHGIQEIHADLALFNGEPVGFRNVRGSAIIDIVEHRRNGDVCIYDVKTGGGRFPDKKMDQYAGEAKARFNPTGTIYVIPIYVEDMFGRDHNRR